MKFRKRPVVVEAVRWDGTNLREVHEFSGGAAGFDAAGGSVLRVITLEGAMVASVGDWIIRGIRGEFYPCKPDIFEATYEPAEES